MNRLRLFFSQWIRAITIFPISFLVLIAMSAVWIAMVYSDFDSTQYLLKIMLACVVALPLTILSPLYTYISNKKTTYKQLILSALWVWVGIVYYMFLPADIDNANNASQVATTGGIVLSRIMLLFTIAWAKKDNQLITWVWWKELLLSIVMWWLAWGIIWGGISASLASLDYLFGITINSHAYGYVGIVSMIFIAWAIALIHIVNQDANQESPTYGRTMRIFGHYIFLPLTIIYGCILISYWIKILLTWVRPKWMIVYMVTWYVGFGILTWLATYPALPNWFISKAHRWLFISFLLTSFLMIQAVIMRVDQYGFTIARYFVCAIIAWIIIASIGSIFFAKRKLFFWSNRVYTLLVLWLISVYGGKRNAVSIANNSQKNILIQSLSQYNITLPLASWSLATIASGDASKIYNTISYICNAWDTDTIFSLLPESERANLNSQSTYMKADYVFNYAWLNYLDRYDSYSDLKELYFAWDVWSEAQSNIPISIAWYTSLYSLTQPKINNKITVTTWTEKISIDLWLYGEDLYKMVTALNNKSSLPDVNKAITHEPWGIVITIEWLKIILTNISGYKTLKDTWDTYTIQYYMWYVLLR